MAETTFNIIMSCHFPSFLECWPFQIIENFRDSSKSQTKQIPTQFNQGVELFTKQSHWRAVSGSFQNGCQVPCLKKNADPVTVLSLFIYVALAPSLVF